MTEQPRSAQWWEDFPAPRSKVSETSAEEVMKLFDDMDLKPDARSFLLVDVRRDDWVVSCLQFLRSHRNMFLRKLLGGFDGKNLDQVQEENVLTLRN